MNKRLPFLSLLWKAIMGCGIILTAMIALYTYYNVNQLSELQANQRAERHQNYIIEFSGLIERSAQSLSNIIDTLPYLENNQEGLTRAIEDNWFTLQLTWGIEGAELFDAEGKSVQRWGDTWLSIDPEILREAREVGTRNRFVSCRQQCYLNLISPVLDRNDKLYILRISASLADLILDFRQISRADIGFMTRDQGLSIHRAKPQWKIASLSNRDRLEPLIHKAILSNGLPPQIPDTPKQRHYESSAYGKMHDLMFFSDPALLGRGAIAVFITDISAFKARIYASRNAYIVLGLLISLATVILLVAVLWRPLMLLRSLSGALPLLAKGKFDEAENRLSQAIAKRLFRDELSELKSTTITVSRQLASFRDHIQANHQRLHELAHFDALTGLINRSHLQEVIDEDYLRGDTQQCHFALLLIDLDNFKRINEGFGHKVGDELLRHISQRLQSCLSEKDCAARLGGDEFCLLLDKIDNAEKVRHVVQRIERAMEEPFKIEHRHIPVYCSIGAVLAPQDGRKASELLQKADLALYRAKSDGKHTSVLFSSELLSDADARLALEAELRDAVKEEQFVLHYQSQIALDSKKLVGFETLLRWQHPERGLLSPFFFIDALESNGLIVPLGKWIIDSACAQLACWHASGHKVAISINLSVRQFSDPYLVNNIQQSVRRYNIDPHYLEFEVTESLLATNIKRAINILSSLRELGCTIAIDDFGTGYSSLAYLKQLPLDKLKVDRAFVKDIPDDKDDMQICTAIIAMAHSLGLKVVAEGIETADQEAFLQERSCEIGQGYLYSKPVSVEEATELYRLNP